MAVTIQIQYNLWSVLAWVNGRYLLHDTTGHRSQHVGDRKGISDY